MACIDVVLMHRNVDFLRDGDFENWPWRGVSEFATPGRNRKREQHVGGDKREGDEEESSPCTGPCKTTTSVRSVPPITINTTRRVHTKNEVAGELGPPETMPNLNGQ